MATSGEKRWPRLGRNRWPLTRPLAGRIAVSGLLRGCFCPEPTERRPLVRLLLCGLQPYAALLAVLLRLGAMRRREC
jgi:hypothetical protein